MDEKICAVCRFCTHEDGRDFVCHNEDSENYGNDLKFDKIIKWACEDFTGHTYKDMELKDALHIETQVLYYRRKEVTNIEADKTESEVT